MKESKIISTSDLFTKEKKKGQQKILTTKDDVPDELPVHEAEEPIVSKAITTSDVKDDEDEKQKP